MKYFLYSLVLLLAVGTLASRPALAQPSSGGPAPTAPVTTPTTTPIDGGASLLLASGLALGLRKLRQRRAR